MALFKKTILPLTHAERLRSTMQVFSQARDELQTLSLEIDEKIDEHEGALITLRSDRAEVKDAIERIKAIAG